MNTTTTFREAAAKLDAIVEERITLQLTPATVAQLQARGITETEARDYLRTKVARTLLDAREQTGCYCPSDCACKSEYRATVCGCTGKH